MVTSTEAIKKLLTLSVSEILDIGAGEGKHAKIFKEHGIKVIELRYPPDYLDVKIDPIECIWVSHVLEHHPNPGLFLKKCFNDLKEDGILAITVPPLKHEIVGGHLTLWNAGLLLYQLILAGFDCSEAAVKTYGYNISIILKKKSFKLPDLKRDFGDIELLSPYFPFPVKHGFDGRIEEVNWSL